jgi:hypothetical protein
MIDTAPPEKTKKQKIKQPKIKKNYEKESYYRVCIACSNHRNRTSQLLNQSY